MILTAGSASALPLQRDPPATDVKLGTGVTTPQLAARYNKQTGKP